MSVPRGVTVSDDTVALRSVPAWVDVAVAVVVVVGLMVNLPLFGYAALAAGGIGLVLWARIRVEVNETGIERAGSGVTMTIPWDDVRRIGWSADSSLMVVICAAEVQGTVPLFRLTTRILWGPTNAQRVDAVVEAIAERIPSSAKDGIEVRTVAGARGEGDNDASAIKGGRITTCDD